MKITGKMLMVNVENEITVGKNGAVEATVEHQIMAYESSDGVDVDVDFVDIRDIKFLGMPIETGYEAYNKFKRQMSELGVDVDGLIDGVCVGLVTECDTEKVKLMFSQMNK
jgi:hypothetical protein